jgi:hypothetical protein
MNTNIMSRLAGVWIMICTNAIPIAWFFGVSIETSVLVVLIATGWLLCICLALLLIMDR